MKNKIKKMAISLCIANALSLTATAAEVPFSPTVSSGGGDKAKNKASNVWLTVDDSLSMGILGWSFYYGSNYSGGNITRQEVIDNCQGNNWVNHRDKCVKAGSKYYGVLNYDPNFPYEENIPVDHNGNQLPLPDNVDETYKLGEYIGQIGGMPNAYLARRYPVDAFIYYAVRNMGVKYRPSFKNPNNRNSVPYIASTTPIPTIKINKTFKSEWNTIPMVTEDDTCDLASNKKRCQVWKTYYQTRMLATKSALSIAMYKYKDSDFRLGYTDLLSHSPVFNRRGQHGGFSSWIHWKANATPYIDRNVVENWSGDDTYDTPFIPRSQLFPLRKNNDDGREAFYKWLFTLSPVRGGTQTRETVSYLFKKIKENAGNNGSIWLEDPSKPYDAETNQAYTCRLNHNMIFTDGEWRDTPESRVVENMTAFNGNSIKTESSVTLPDGVVYSPSAAYAKVYKASPDILTLPTSMTSCDLDTFACWKPQKDYVKNANNGRMMGIADIAFQGWATDLDDDNSNNKAGEDGALILPNDEQKKYIDKHGNKIIYKNNGSEYWSHFNDPAAWQHINTHLIGFGLGSRGDSFNKLYINAPQSIDEAEDLDKNVTNGGVGLNAFSNGNRSWVRGEHKGNFGPKNLLSDAGRTAITGRGMYFNAKGPGEVIEAFDRVFARIEKSGEASPAVTGSAGTASSSQQLDNSYFSSRYDGKSFTGELLKYELFSGKQADASACFGSVPSPLPPAGTRCDTPLWNAAKRLDKNSRNIITSKRDNGTYDVVSFSKDNISNEDKTRLYASFPNFLDQTEDGLETLFNYVIGDETDEGTKFRSRDGVQFEDGTTGRNILGAIMRSSPVYVGVPNSYLFHLDSEGSTYQNYITYLRSYLSGNSNGEKEVVYVASNDGMLHAFKANDNPSNSVDPNAPTPSHTAPNAGNELFAYVPNAVYDKLGKTVIAGEQLSLVDGNIDVQMVNFDTSWNRVLVGAMGGGAKGLYALNVTEPKASTIMAQTKANWEYSRLESSNIGNIVAKPAIIQLQDNTWAAVVGNGYNAESNKAALIVINLETGETIQELVLDKATLSPSAEFNYVDDSKTNGLGPLYFYRYPNKDKDKSNRYDRAYAGDLQGNLWVFDLTNSSENGGITVANQKPLFTATATNANNDTVRQPITVAPKVVKHPLGYGYVVHFGTGALFSINDLSSKVPNAIYAIWDDWVSSEQGGLPDSSPRTEVVTESELYSIDLASAEIGSGSDKSTIRHLENNSPLKWKLDEHSAGKRGWKIDLLPGERAWQPAQTIYGADNTQALSYNTVRYNQLTDATQCSTGEVKAESWRLAFNINDAGQMLANTGVLDVNSDEHITEDDLITLGSTPSTQVTVIPTGIIKTDEIAYNATSQNINTGGDPATDNKKSCRFNRQVNTGSSGGMSGVTVQRCSYFSSWHQLK